MNKDQMYLDRALVILHNMALEYTGWRAIFRRWFINDEPLRNDAANLLREIGAQRKRPEYTKLAGSGS